MKNKMELEHGRKLTPKKKALSKEYFVRGYKYKDRTEAKINVPFILSGMKVKLIEVVSKCRKTSNADTTSPCINKANNGVKDGLD